MADRVAVPVHPAPVPGFLETVDAEVARIEAQFAVFLQGAFMGAYAAMCAAAQRPTEASARATRAAAHRDGLTVPKRRIVDVRPCGVLWDGLVDGEVVCRDYSRNGAERLARQFAGLPVVGGGR